jgi:phosphoribosylformylglycinamidine synthase
MAFGNMTGVDADADALALIDETGYPGAVLLELDGAAVPALRALLAEKAPAARWAIAARTIAEPVFRAGGEERPLADLRRAWESALDRVYPQVSGDEALSVINDKQLLTLSQEETAKKPEARGIAQNGVKQTHIKTSREKAASRPLVVLPVFPGTNGEWDMEKAFLDAGARTRQVVFRNRSTRDIAESTAELAEAIAGAHIVAFSGGFSAGDEPDGSGKFIANVIRAPAVADAVSALLENRDGLALGICNGFQALVKLGLVPYGRFAQAAPGSPTLTFNRAGRHISRMARTVVISNASPWLALEEPGTVHVLPVSHGEGRFVISEAEGKTLFDAGQVAACYADKSGRPALAEPDNPNGSDFAIEAITSPGGRVLGKMGHSERRGEFVHVNIPGNKHQRIFEAGVRYFT